MNFVHLKFRMTIFINAIKKGNLHLVQCNGYVRIFFFEFLLSLCYVVAMKTGLHVSLQAMTLRES